MTPICVHSPPQSIAEALLHAPPASVQDAARQRLRASPYGCLRRIRCDYHEGVVTLHGRVRSFFLKQTAQEAVRRLAGVDEVANRIEVVDGLETVA